MVNQDATHHAGVNGEELTAPPSTGLDTELFMINADGSGLTRLTTSIGVDGSPRGR